MLGSTHYRYTKHAYEFEVKHADEGIFVTVPLPGSDSRYRTRINSTENAEEYLTKHSSHLEKIENSSVESACVTDAAEIEKELR